jgi:hypothetical protein
MKRGTLIAMAIVLVGLGLVIGWLAGRWSLEQAWATPHTISTADVQRSSDGDADPTPAAGTVVLASMPIQRARRALRALVDDAPVRMRIGSIGRSDGEMFLHLTLVNRGTCAVTHVDGVAYGFDAWGRSARLNRGGESYVAFHATGLSLAPGGSTQEEYPLHHPDTASIALAQVDHVTCADGTEWARD